MPKTENDLFNIVKTGITKILITFSCLTFLIFGVNACKDKSSDPPSYNIPSVIAGQITNEERAAVSNAFVSLATAPDYLGQFTETNGYFRLENIPAGKHRLKVERVGYQIYEADVPSAINGFATMNLALKRQELSVPAIKPVSLGMVRIKNHNLEVDFDKNGVYEPFLIKGVAYSPSPICSKPITLAVHQRSAQYIRNMNANTIRTYAGADKQMLQLFADNNIRVIVGFWVDYTANLSIEAVRQQVKNDFTSLVYTLKDSPGLLMWNIGNEQNYQNGNNAHWYTLVQELAVLAYQIEEKLIIP